MDKTYEFMGELAIALYSKKIKITLNSLRTILNEKEEFKNFSKEKSRGKMIGFGQSVSAAWKAWSEEDPVIHHAIAHTFTDKNGSYSWKK